MHVSLIRIDTVINHIQDWCHSDRCHYICVSNVHMCMEAFDSDEFQQVINNADIVVPDGKPLVWGQKLLGHKNAQQVRGQDLTMGLCELAVEKGFKIGFYGAAPETLTTMQSNLLEQFPTLDISYSYSPPYRALTLEEDADILAAINEQWRANPVCWHWLPKAGKVDG